MACCGLVDGHRKEGPCAHDIAAVQEKYRADKEKALHTFAARSELEEGLRTVASVRGFRITVDEPRALGGTNQGPNPVELVLAALGTCQEITYKAYATATGVPINSVSASVEGKIDLRGFYGVSSYEEARPGFGSVEATVSIESDADEASLANLQKVVDAHCPVLDLIRNRVPVTLKFTTTNSGVAGTDQSGPTAGDIASKQAELEADPPSAKASFKTQSKLERGLRTEVAIRKFNVVVDEPEAMGGTDEGPNPVEIVLAALGTCQEITYKAYATALGIPVWGISSHVEGDIDLRGFYGVSPYDEARPGFSSIRCHITIDSPASEEDLAKLKSAVDAHCPVLDILANEVPVCVKLAVVHSG